MRVCKGSFSLIGTSDRYKLSSCERDKGIKKASLWERITGRATQIIVDGQKYHINKRSLNKYLCRKLTSEDCPKTQTAVDSFFKAAKITDNFQSFVKSKKEILTRRGNILKGLSGVKAKKISGLGKGNSSDQWLISLVKIGSRASSAAPLLGQASKTTRKRAIKQIRPQSWHGITEASSTPIKGYCTVRGRKMPVFDFSKMDLSKFSTQKTR